MGELRLPWQLSAAFFPFLQLSLRLSLMVLRTVSPSDGKKNIEANDAYYKAAICLLPLLSITSFINPNFLFFIQAT